MDINLVSVYLKESVQWIIQNTFGIFSIALALIFFYCSINNQYVLNKYKREKHFKKYKARRRFEDGYEEYKNKGKKDEKDENKNGRDFIYLIDEECKKYYRVADLYTLNRLGYPRPSRANKESSKLDEHKYTLGNEIKIYNIISDIE